MGSWETPRDGRKSGMPVARWAKTTDNREGDFPRLGSSAVRGLWR